MSLDQLDRVPSSTSKSESVQAEESAEALSNPSGRYFVAFAEEADDDTLDQEVEVRSIGLLLNVAVASSLSLSLLSLILSLSLSLSLAFSALSLPLFSSLSLFVSVSAAFAFVSASLCLLLSLFLSGALRRFRFPRRAKSLRLSFEICRRLGRLGRSQRAGQKVLAPNACRFGTDLQEHTQMALLRWELGAYPFRCPTTAAVILLLGQFAEDSWTVKVSTLPGELLGLKKDLLAAGLQEDCLRLHSSGAGALPQ